MAGEMRAGNLDNIRTWLVLVRFPTVVCFDVFLPRVRFNNRAYRDASPWFAVAIPLT